jgi:uncharacterized membrane protein YedE/YeeE
MDDAERILRPYRVFQRSATGLGVLGLLVGLGWVLGGSKEQGWGIFALGGVVLIHGLTALVLLQVREARRSRSA